MSASHMVSRVATLIAAIFGIGSLAAATIQQKALPQTGTDAAFGVSVEDSYTLAINLGTSASDVTVNGVPVVGKSLNSPLTDTTRAGHLQLAFLRRRPPEP